MRYIIMASKKLDWITSSVSLGPSFPFLVVSSKIPNDTLCWDGVWTSKGFYVANGGDGCCKLRMCAY